MAAFVDVIIPVPLQGLFTYALPVSLQQQAQAGCRVIVPFGNKRSTTGLIVRLHDTPPADPDVNVKDVMEVVDEVPCILPSQLSLWQWIADYYVCSIGEVFKAAMPGKVKPLSNSPRGGKDSLSSKIDTSGYAALPPTGGAGRGAVGFSSSLPTLSPAQSTALASIKAGWQTHPVCLLQGVTSSGKTEIYIHLITEAIAQGKQVLYLLPEIVLTSQLTDRLQAVFGDHLGVYHSKFTDAQRSRVWHRQLSQQPFDIIVGVRSSVFLPFQRLGLVIVDEEHEVNFKQQEPAPRYNARNVALLMAARAKALTLLGTATPSFESYYLARTGKYALVQLKERYGKVQLPRIEIVDVKEQRHKRLMNGAFSQRLLEEIRAALDSHQQVILFQNRRGYAPQVQCHICGWVPTCPRCDVPMTMHARSGMMTCHYCGYTVPVPSQCPACENKDLRQHGFGTERIEDDIQKLFPEARVVRMDLDTTTTRQAYEQIIHDFAAGQTDILVGTQMVTKGLDFENVSVVGILSADTMLNQPDFRAFERSFQMMSQVAGRAGRRSLQGTVILQTMNPQLSLIKQVVEADYDAAYHEQMLERRQFAYPPFTRMITVYFKHRQLATIETLAREATIELRQLLGTRVLGPDEPPVGRVQNLFIRRVILKLESRLPIAEIKKQLLEIRRKLLMQKQYAAAHIYFDVDPL